MYPTLKDWAAELKVFYHNQHYPGSWNGEDKHGNDRELLKSSLEDLPFAVREWLKKEEGKQRHFSVQDGVVFFAPGAIYPILPLWVEESDGEDSEINECEGTFKFYINFGNPCLKESFADWFAQGFSTIWRIIRPSLRMVLCLVRLSIRTRARMRSRLRLRRFRLGRVRLGVGRRGRMSCSRVHWSVCSLPRIFLSRVDNKDIGL